MMLTNMTFDGHYLRQAWPPTKMSSTNTTSAKHGVDEHLLATRAGAHKLRWTAHPTNTCWQARAANMTSNGHTLHHMTAMHLGRNMSFAQMKCCFGDDTIAYTCKRTLCLLISSFVNHARHMMWCTIDTQMNGWWGKIKSRVYRQK